MGKENGNCGSCPGKFRVEDLIAEEDMVVTIIIPVISREIPSVSTGVSIAAEKERWESTSKRKTL